MGKYSSQPTSVELGRTLPQLCMQWAASPRENACIFEKCVELFRHTQKKTVLSDSLFSCIYLQAQPAGF